jgi:hypothetical protein
MTEKYLDKVIAIPYVEDGLEGYHVGRVVQDGNGLILRPYLSAKAGTDGDPEKWISNTARSVVSLQAVGEHAPSRATNSEELSLCFEVSLEGKDPSAYERKQAPAPALFPDQVQSSGARTIVSGFARNRRSSRC